MPSMQIPFTAQQFFEVIARYNEAVWPAQLLLHALALLAVVFVLHSQRRGSGVVAVLAAAVQGLVLMFRPRPVARSAEGVS
jgi:hypothetical protein